MEGELGNQRGDRPAGVAPPRACTRPRAFTLQELLIVVVIVAVLSGVLVPVVLRAQQRSRSTACASNLRQLGVAMLTYADDNDGRLPLGLDSYWKEVERVPLYGAPWIYQTLEDRTSHAQWHCPADQGFMWWNSDFDRILVNLTPSCFETTGQSYDYNLLFVWDYAYRRISPIPIWSVRQPASIALLKDAHFSWHNNNHPRDPKERDLSNPPSWNALYLDGHVTRKVLPWYRDYMVDTRTWWFRDNNPRL
jgi:prepilin-type N-terminal cleavage/methylation domain-containing protein